ncbi:hypothetical protein C8J56DRAFT_1000661 [Mycena floridula]|nr:hypothetical protein C8J56DRAFT_1000661 [Mycena floridula]
MQRCLSLFLLVIPAFQRPGYPKATISMPDTRRDGSDLEDDKIISRRFQVSVASTSKTLHPPKKTVKIKKTFIFAGKPVTKEVTEIPEASVNAKKWPLWTRLMTTDPEPSNSSTSKRPGPRKPKLSTLDKSAMGWRSHFAETGSGMKDESEANLIFLDRVNDRKSTSIEANKSTK